MNAYHSRRLGHLYITDLEKSFCWFPEKEWILLHMVPISVEFQASKPVDTSYFVPCVVCRFISGFFQLGKGGLKASKPVHVENTNLVICSFKQKIAGRFSDLKGSKTIIIFNNFLKSLMCLSHSSQAIRDVLPEWRHWFCSFLSHTMFKTCNEVYPARQQAR